MPRVPPPCSREEQLGRHIRFAPRAVPPAALTHMLYVRTYPRYSRVLRFFFFYICLLYEYVRKRKHSAAQQHRENNENENEKCKKLERKNAIPVPLMYYVSARAGTPCTGRNRRKVNSKDSLSASYAARPSRDHPATDSVREKLSSLSATVGPVARLA